MRTVVGSKRIMIERELDCTPRAFRAATCPVAAERGRVRAGLAILVCCALVALLAQVRIPVPGTPVPMTLSPLAVLMTGFFLPVRRAVATLALYLALGTAGLPVFSPGSLGLFGPTGGYLVGFVFAAGVVAAVRNQPPTCGRLIVAGACGTLVIFACGVAWLSAWQGMNIPAALAGGLLPFIPKAVVQLGVAVAARQVLSPERTDRVGIRMR